MTDHMTLPFQQRFLRNSGANGTKLFTSADANGLGCA